MFYWVVIHDVTKKIQTCGSLMHALNFGSSFLFVAGCFVVLYPDVYLGCNSEYSEYAISRSMF